MHLYKEAFKWTWMSITHIYHTRSNTHRGSFYSLVLLFLLSMSEVKSDQWSIMLLDLQLNKDKPATNSHPNNKEHIKEGINRVALIQIHSRWDVNWENNGAVQLEPMLKTFFSTSSFISLRITSCYLILLLYFLVWHGDFSLWWRLWWTQLYKHTLSMRKGWFDGKKNYKHN